MYESFQALQSTALACQGCKLCQTRHSVVFGAGSQHAKIMFIGEGPGENEDLQGEPFVGRAGQLLDKILTHVGLSRQNDVYITNMVKCRPPKNRDPERDEVEACMPYLRAQIEFIRPKIIVCLGRVAACALIDPNFKVTRQHGEFFDKDGLMMMGTFHPAALLRNPVNKPGALDDFINLRVRLDSLPLF